MDNNLDYRIDNNIVEMFISWNFNSRVWKLIIYSYIFKWIFINVFLYNIEFKWIIYIVGYGILYIIVVFF